MTYREVVIVIYSIHLNWPSLCFIAMATSCNARYVVHTYMEYAIIVRTYIPYSTIMWQGEILDLQGLVGKYLANWI